MKISLYGPIDKSRIPQLNPKDIEMLWVEDRFDGPLTGVLAYQEQKYWFEVFDCYDEHLGYQYVVIPLSDAEFALVKSAHAEYTRRIEEFRNDFYSPVATAFFAQHEADHERTHPFQIRERISGWFCERGTTGQQFAAIKVFDQNGKLIEFTWGQKDPRKE